MTCETTSDRAGVAGLFPPSAAVVGGRLEVGGCALSDVAERFGTPTLVLDEAALRARARRYVDGLARRWPASRVVWASKSLPVTAIYRLMGEEGLGADVAGGGELEMALAGAMDPANLVLHGNAKTDAELTRALAVGVGLIVVDNLDELDRLERLARGPQAVLLRVTPGVEAATHEAIATGHVDSKFGLSPRDLAEARRRLAGHRHLRLEGLHVHVGSQITSTAPFVAALEAIAPLGDFPVYDLGGGLGARYTDADQPPSVEEYLDALTGAARTLLPAGATMLIEPGRSMVAEAACTLYRVVGVKRQATRRFVAVDGGMADNLEVSLYGQRFAATLVDRVGGGDTYALVGRHCESGDQLIDAVALDAPAPGDVLAVPVTGAYCLTMANNYNGALRPPVVFVRDGDARAVVRRETYADLLARDVPA